MEELIALFLFATTMLVTPGPNNILIMNSGLHFGIKKSLPHFWGICLGFPCMVLLITLGLGVIIMDFEWIKHLLKIGGAIYMSYLAWCIFTAKVSTSGYIENKPFSFLHAAWFQWINVKAWMMVISAISLFTFTNNFFTNALVLSGVFLVIGIPSLAIWLFGGVFLKRFLKQEKHYRWLNAIMAAALVISIVMILLD